MEMGEAACLMRSVSQPLFASCELREGDPLRALTTSISFGRFLTEPLDWEKWSSFSHNRTLEDVKKYSRPGAVAEKKAFFEAYYKRFAATKKREKSPKKENKPPNRSAQSQTHVIGFVNISNTCKTESPTLAADENMRSIEPETSNADVCSPPTNLVSSKIGNVDDIILSTGQMEQETASSKDVFSPSTGIVFSGSGNVEEDKGPSNRVHSMEMTPNQDICSPSTTNLVFPEIRNVDDIIPSIGQLEQEKPSTNIVFSEPGNVENKVPSNRGAEMEITSNEDVKPSTNLVFSQFGDKNKKRQIKDKVPGQKKPETSSSVSRKASAPTSRPWKAARDEIEKKRSALQSLHMSMNFPPRNKNGTSETLSKPKERCSEVPLTRVLSSNGVKKNSQVPRVENKRSKPLLDGSSVNVSKIDVVKPLSTNISEASTSCTKKSRSTTVPWSFSFRSEERAAKRKAKLEEKCNTNMAKRVQLQPKMKKLEEKCNTNMAKRIQLQPKMKDKAPDDNKKLRWSTALEAKPITSGASSQKDKAPDDNKKLRWSTALEAKPITSGASSQKVPPTRSCLPELGRKLTPRLVEDACYHRSPPRISSSKPKNFIEINKKKLTSFAMASLPSKKRHDIQK